MAPVQSKPEKVATPVKGVPPIKKASPKRGSSKANKRPGFTVTVWGFHPTFPLEVYSYRKGSDDDGYTHTLRQSIDGNADTIPILDDNGFIQYFVRRQHRDKNQVMTNADNWPCHLIVRWVPNQEPSTPATRTEGLRILKNFFMSSEWSKFPPRDIVTVDMTNTDDPIPLDHFFLDEQVALFIKDIFPDEVANDRFAVDYPDVAKMFFSRDLFPPEAVTQYGYGSQKQQAMADGFHAGSQLDKPTDKEPKLAGGASNGQEHEDDTPEPDRSSDKDDLDKKSSPKRRKK